MKLLQIYIVLVLFLLEGCRSNRSAPQLQSNKDNITIPSGKKSDSGVVLKTLFGKDTLLKGIGANRASVFIFLSPQCPLSQSYSLPLNEFSKKYKNNHIGFYGIFPGASFTYEEMQSFQKKYDIQFPLLVDTAYILTQLFRAEITPEVFVTESSGAVLYSGRIDNWAYEVSKKRSLITEHDLQDALESILNNRPVAISKTKAVGCFIEIPKK